jgi:hypothetical protein
MLVLVVTIFAGVGCGEAREIDATGETVVLNERLFAVQSMETLGGGCTTFVLGADDGSGGSVGGGQGEFTVSRRFTNDAVFVEVRRGADLLEMRRYDETFFRSGALDEFVVSAISGDDLRARYWGTLHADGAAVCAPLDKDGP